MGNINFGGLASGLDTSSIIQQLLSIESRPITFLSQQKSTLEQQSTAYKDLNTRLSALESAAFELTTLSSLVAHDANSSNTSTLFATANSDATTGSYQVDVLQLATTSRTRTGTGVGQGNEIGGIANISAFSGNTVSLINSSNRLSNNLSQGTFFINGQSILVTNSDTLDAIFTKISTATGGSVTGILSTDPSKGGQVIELSSASAITASNGTSNFLSVFKLNTASYSGGILSSSDAVDSVKANLALDGSEGATNLFTPAVTSGTLTINGEDIAYNTSSDSLNGVIARINASGAGVRASFSNIGGGQVSLSNESNGPLAIQISDTGTLAAALGLTALDSASIGQAAQIKVDGGATQSFNTNNGIAAAGLDGITLDLRDSDPGNPVSITVNTNTEGAVTKVKSFIDKFNAVITKIDQLTSFDPETGDRGLLIGDSSINSVRNRLKTMIFDRVGGLSGSNGIGSLSELGLSTGAIGSAPGTTIKLELDTSKLSAALKADPTRTAQIFGAEETESGSPGIMNRMKEYLNGLSSVTGVFASRQKSNTRKISTIDHRIESLNDRLVAKQKFLETQFTALERTISRLQSQQSSLSALFSNFSR